MQKLKLIYPLMAILLLAACSKKEEHAAVTIPGIIPKPVSLTPGNGHLHWDKSVAIVAKSADEKNVGELLGTFLKAKNIDASVVEFSEDKNQITLYTEEDSTLHNEGYKLTIDEKGVSIHANNGAGLFYGAQTLLQLLTENSTEIPFVTITDYPRFAYRGLHLDVGRHMFPPEFIKKYIDLLAHHKFNRFHWHLTEDQGWRIEIKK